MNTQILYRLECLEDATPVRGNALASGDPIQDQVAENYIIAQLAKGKEWSWCTVKITAFIQGIATESSVYLGCCSYVDLQDFIDNSGYYEDMIEDARKGLIEKIAKVVIAYKNI